jgi:hypothetical protein
MKCSKFKTRSQSDTKTSTRWYKGPHHALWCGVHSSSSKQGLPANFPVLRWVTAGPYKLATTSKIFRHLCTQKDPQARLEQLKLSKADPSTWPQIADSCYSKYVRLHGISSRLCQTCAKSEFLLSSFSPIQIISKERCIYSNHTRVTNN